ncbi:pimeloyl-ACP methyl ester carboxylesterase [Kineococcus xinjiangensis]|uniref:Pimeloyl-ACP methyl ester carboxylesterase n=1 Tax=Kineococcus xinjiangensis TaxID=512762 RepID=A0A2S6IJ18_9ACTN|nr:alpha/beta hydrolase [Kineococcus xinjiangensis]PPK94150.1 pimeloyl-ACP methyl ester carboxylesterase [Kineococcus xinjiangensis]
MDVPLGRTELVETANHRLNVWRAGDAGPALLLIHGIPTNHRLWWDVVPRLQEHARVFAVDMLGYGDSPAPEGQGVDLASQAAALVELLDALGLDRVGVVGHDLGGGVAQILATAASDRVAGMVVSNGVCFDGWPVPVVKAMKASWPVLQRLPSTAVEKMLRAGLRPLFGHQERAPQAIDRFVAPWSRPEGPSLLARHLRAADSVYTQTVAPFLGRLDIPVEVCWGRLDHQMKPRYGERLARSIPGANLTWVEDASHFVPVDRPDAVAAAVRRMLGRL